MIAPEPDAGPTRAGTHSRPLPPLARLRPGLFYGWFVVLGLACVAYVAVGVGFYGQTLLLDGLVREHGWSRASVAGASSVYFVVSAIVGAWVGRSVDRLGGRLFLACGCVVLSASLLAVSVVERPWHLYVLFAVMAVGFAMSGNVPSSAIAARWFVSRRALALALSYTGVSLGGITLLPLGTWLIGAYGLDRAVQVLALLVVLIAFPWILWVVRERPGDYGLVPDGSLDLRPENPLLEIGWQHTRWRAREAAGSGAFWLVSIAFGGVLFAQVATLIHALALFRESMSAGTAALAVGTIAFGSTSGRLVLGLFADRLDKRRVCMVLFGVQAIALLVFASTQGTLPLFAVAFFFGTTVGNIFMLQSLIVGELFGMSSFGTVYGLMTLITQVVSGLGPWVLGLLFDVYGGYGPPLRILACIALLASLLMLAVRPPRAPGEGP